jgi:predicted  nucleic acid-binding Zn-ribbon protein
MTIEATGEQRHDLLALQALDTEVDRLARRAAHPPAARDAAATAAQLSALAKRVTALVGERGRLRELAAARGRRAALAARLDAAVLDAYERARRAVREPAVVTVGAKGTCGGCRLTIPALELDRIRSSAAAALPRCPECDRYLVV